MAEGLALAVAVAVALGVVVGFALELAVGLALNVAVSKGELNGSSVGITSRFVVATGCGLDCGVRYFIPTTYATAARMAIIIRTNATIKIGDVFFS